MTCPLQSQDLMSFIIQMNTAKHEVPHYEAFSNPRPIGCLYIRLKYHFQVLKFKLPSKLVTVKYTNLSACANSKYFVIKFKIKYNDNV